MNPYIAALQQLACVNTYFEIDCQPGHMIVINSATYGILENNPCHAPHPGNCASSRAVLVVNERCSGHANCTFNVTATAFAGLCPDGQNGLSVDYECVESK